MIKMINDFSGNSLSIVKTRCRPVSTLLQGLTLKDNYRYYDQINLLLKDNHIRGIKNDMECNVLYCLEFHASTEQNPRIIVVIQPNRHPSPAITNLRSIQKCTIHTQLYAFYLISQILLAEALNYGLTLRRLIAFIGKSENQDMQSFTFMHFAYLYM